MKKLKSLVQFGVVLFGIAILTPNPIYAQDGSKYAAAFLDIPLGVRAVGMGGQFTPTDNHDVTAFYWNPAALAMVKGKLVTTMYSNQFGTIGSPLSNYFHIGYAQDLGNGVGFSVNWIRNSVSDIPYTNDPRINGTINISDIINGNFDNGGATFTNADNALFVSVAKNLINNLNFGWQYFGIPVEVPIGVTFKYISQGFSGNEQVKYSGTGIGVDLGTMFRFKLGDFLSKPYFGYTTFGFTMKDVFNTPVAWNTETKAKSAVSRSALFSFSYQQPMPFLASSLLLAASYGTKYDGELSLGLEYRYRDLLALRVGTYAGDLTLGAGLYLFKAIFIDYAYQSHDLGSPHRIGLTANLAQF